MADYRDGHSSNLMKLSKPEKRDSGKKSYPKTKKSKAFGGKNKAENKSAEKNIELITGKKNKEPSEKNKKPSKEKGKGGKVAIFVFFGIIIILILFTVIGPHVSNGMKTGYVQNGLIEKSVDGEAVFIRDEMVVSSEFSGKVIAAINEGERASKDEVVAYVVDGEHEEIVEELKRIEERIISAQTYNDNVSDSVTSGINDVNSAVLSEINSFTPELSKGSLRSFSDVKSDINSYFSMQSEMSLNVESRDEYISLLQDQRQGLLNQLSGYMYELKAPEAGVVSYCLDGQENKVSSLTVENINNSGIEGLDKNAERTVGNNISSGENVFRITTGTDYYIAVRIPAEDAGSIKEGASVTLQAKNHSFKALAQVVSLVKEDENSLAVLKSSSNMSTTISYRIQDVNLIYESVSGMRIPLRALTDWDSAGRTAKVTVIRSNTVYGIYVNVLSKNDEYAIVTNQTAFDDLSEVSGLKPNDMYVQNPDSVKEGELIE